MRGTFCYAAINNEGKEVERIRADVWKGLDRWIDSMQEKGYKVIKDWENDKSEDRDESET